MTDRSPQAREDLRAMFAALPKVDAVPRPARVRWPGLAGWDGRRRVVLAVAAVALFWLYGGVAALASGGLWAGVLVAVGALLGGLVAATYVPARGGRVDLSPCSVMPLLWVVAFVPMALGDGTGGMGVLVTFGLTAVFAVQRAAGFGCRV